MNKIIISSDSVCDLSQELIEKNGNIVIIPLMVTFGDESFHDGINVTDRDIYKYVSETKMLPKTSATSPADYTEHFTNLLKEYDQVIHFCIGSGFSSCCQNAKLASEGLNVSVIDSENLSSGCGFLVMVASDMAANGKSSDEIIAAINSIIPRVRTSFLIDNLEYLQKGGRCSSVAVLGANLLKLKPCIIVKDGAMVVGKKYRGTYDNCLVEYASEVLKDSKPYLDYVFVTHTKCNETVIADVIKKIKEILPGYTIYETKAGATITCHCGPNTLGVLYVE